MWPSLNLLTLKPLLYVCNVSEEDLASGKENPWIAEVKEHAQHRVSRLSPCCCQLNLK